MRGHSTPVVINNPGCGSPGRVYVIFAPNVTPRRSCDTFMPSSLAQDPTLTMNRPAAHPLALPAFALLLFASCGSEPQVNEEAERLRAELRESQVLLTQRDSSMNLLLGSFNRISENIRTIREKQGSLSDTRVGGDGARDLEQRIAEDLASMDALMDENRALIARLRKEAKASAGAIATMERTIEEMERMITERDADITVLKEQLASSNSSLATLIEMYRDKDQLAALQRSEMNTAWYTVGTTKELRDKGIITKEGGVAGLGRSDKLSGQAMGSDHFKRIDITETTEIPILAKKARLVTTHPEGSYRWEGSVDKLMVTDAPAFWSLSKYLVVVVD